MRRYGSYIHGAWEPGGVLAEVHSPFDGEIAGEIGLAGMDTIERGIASACSGFESMRRLPSHRRAGILHAIASGIHERREDFARTMTQEMGKPISMSRLEVERTVMTFTDAAEEAKRIGGEVIAMDLAAHSEGRTGIVKRFPIGPILAITPFNFPLNLVAHKVGPALACGCSVVVKPSPKAPLSSCMLFDVLHSSGVPAGAANLIHCSLERIDQLVSDKRFAMLSFTGSAAVGWSLKARTGARKQALELGGNAAVIVDEGVDPTAPARRIAAGAFGNAGQSCISVQRVFVHRSGYDRFAGEFVGQAREMKAGNPAESSVLIGPMIDEESARRAEGWIREAVMAGGRILTGGTRKGAFLDATILENVPRDANVCTEEVFAPVAVLEQFSDFSDVLSRVNQSAYGLQAGVFTGNLRNALLAFAELEVGGVVINDYPTYRIDHMPYGGVKQSGLGREGVRYAIEEMTERKLLVLS